MKIFESKYEFYHQGLDLILEVKEYKQWKPQKIKHYWAQTSFFYDMCRKTTNYTINDCTTNESEIVCCKMIG